MSTPTPTTGFVLAGGKSRRLGRNKALLNWQGRTFVEHMKSLLSEVCDSVIVIGYSGLPDSVPDLGPIGGIATALDVSATEQNLIVAVDLPLLTVHFLKHFRQVAEKSSLPLTACQTGSTHPLCLGVRRSLRGDVVAFIESGGRSIQAFVAGIPHETVEGDPEMFQNINTEADYERASKHINRDSS